MDKIMIIGANWEQEPLLQYAKEMGLYVIATNPYPEAEGFKYSDEDYVVEPRDLQKLDMIFQKVQPDAVIADECDYSMFAVAYLTNKYNLPGPKMDSLIITNNKYLERKFAEKGNIRQPKFRLCMTFNEVIEAVKEIGLPVMLKPVDNRGTIGVRKVESEHELERVFYDTLAGSHARQLLVEEYIDGVLQVNVEGICAGKFHNLTFSNKQKYPGACVDMHLVYPGELPKELIEKLYNLNSKLVETMGIDYGLTHTEFIIKDGQPYLLEMHNRGAGINVSNKIIPAVTGIETSDFLIRSSLGEKVSLEKYSTKRWKVVLHFFDFGRGRVSKITNLDSAKKIEGVLTLRLNFNLGDYLGGIQTGPSRHGCVIVAANSLYRCKSLVEEVKSKIKIEFQEEETAKIF